jgi:glutathione S-transferase
MMAYMSGKEQPASGLRPLAPPFLETADGFVLTQTPAILMYLAPQLGLAGNGSPAGAAVVHSLALTGS